MKELQKNIVMHGLKVTPQRLAILKYLRENRIHPTAEKIYRELVKDYPSISLKTVYDALAVFVGAGMIRQLDIDPQKMRFDFNTASHEHFYCRVCNGVYDVVADEWTGYLKNLEIIEGHHVNAISIHLSGTCRDCRNKVLISHG